MSAQDLCSYFQLSLGKFCFTKLIKTPNLTVKSPVLYSHTLYFIECRWCFHHQKVNVKIQKKDWWFESQLESERLMTLHYNM